MGTMNIYNTSGSNKASLTFTGSSDVTVDTNKVSNVLNAPCFSAYLGSNQTINSSTVTKYAANLTRFNVGSCYDTTNYRFTPNVAGYYLVSATNWYTTGTGNVATYLYKNGNLYSIEYRYESSGLSSSCQSIIYLNGTTDYVEVYFWQSTGSTQTLDSNVANPGFSAVMVRGA